MKNLLTRCMGIVAISILILSCASTNRMTLNVTEPAPVFLNKDIQKIGIINRSAASQQNKVADEIDKVLSAEGKELDKQGAEKAITGLYDELQSSGDFQKVAVLTDENLKSPGLGIFPAKLDWDQVAGICSENDLDILYVLSFYDTDSKIDYHTATLNKETPLGVKIPVLEHEATIHTLVKMGWRIYDPVDKMLYDEYIMNQPLLSKGRGLNPAKALEAVLGRKEQVMDASADLGHRYGQRIFPYRIRVARDYFVRGTDNFEVAKRRAQAGDWNGAADLWQQETSSANGKVAGRACYNMAIINEINGDLEQALEWASRSYTDYNNKIALRYINILKDRIHKNQLLAVQNK